MGLAARVAYLTSSAKETTESGQLVTVTRSNRNGTA